MFKRRQTKRELGIAELVTGCILIVVTIGIIYSTRNMKNIVDGIPGPRYMPLLYSAAMVLLVFLYWLEALLGNNLRTEKIPSLKGFRIPMSFLSIGVLIVLTWEGLGAIVSVALGSFAELLLLQKYSWQRSIIVAIVLSIFTGILFEAVLGIPLPPGVLRSILR